MNIASLGKPNDNIAHAAQIMKHPRIGDCYLDTQHVQDDTSITDKATGTVWLAFRFTFLTVVQPLGSGGSPLALK